MRCHWWQEQASNSCEIAISNNEDKKPPLMAAKMVKWGVEFDVHFWFNWQWEQASNSLEITVSNNGDRRRKQAASYGGKIVKRGVEFEVFFWYNWEVNDGIVQYNHMKGSRRAMSMLSSHFHFHVVDGVRWFNLESVGISCISHVLTKMWAPPCRWHKMRWRVDSFWML